MSPLNIAFLKEVTKIYMKIDKQNHEQVKIKLNTIKRSSVFVWFSIFLKSK